MIESKNVFYTLYYIAIFVIFIACLIEMRKIDSIVSRMKRQNYTETQLMEAGLYEEINY